MLHWMQTLQVEKVVKGNCHAYSTGMHCALPVAGHGKSDAQHD
jgi:hypothetical protein